MGFQLLGFYCKLSQTLNPILPKPWASIVGPRSYSGPPCDTGFKVQVVGSEELARQGYMGQRETYKALATSMMIIYTDLYHNRVSGSLCTTDITETYRNVGHTLRSCVSELRLQMLRRFENLNPEYSTSKQYLNPQSM